MTFPNLQNNLSLFILFFEGSTQIGGKIRNYFILWNYPMHILILKLLYFSLPWSQWRHCQMLGPGQRNSKISPENWPSIRTISFEKSQSNGERWGNFEPRKLSTSSVRAFVPVECFRSLFETFSCHNPNW